MKIRDYTFNNGNCVIHDTTAMSTHNSMAKKQILKLIQMGEGELTGFTGVTYKITQEGDSICISVDVYGVPLWISFICSSIKSANMAKQFLIYHANTYPELLRAKCKLPEYIIAPCIITMVQPSAIFVSKDTIRLLGGVPRDFAAVFLNSTEMK